MNTAPPPCDADIFRDGIPLLAADTGDSPLNYDSRGHCRDGETVPGPRASGFETWVVALREASGQRIDWHYSGGRAQVLYIGDRRAIIDAIESNPCPAKILCWLGEGEELYRAGVTPMPEDVLAVSGVIRVTR